MSETCSICQDVFEEPKFLNCGHTFCRDCIEGCVDTSSRKDRIVCPLCREVTMYPPKGVRSLLSNFFVKTRTQVESKIRSCNECKCISRARSCHHCDVILCERCISSHVQEVSKSRSVHDSTTESVYSDMEQDVESMGIEGAWFSQAAPTKFHYEHQGQIDIARDIVEAMSGRSLFGTGEFLIQSPNTCIVAPRGGNFILEYNLKGEEIGRRYVPFEVMGVSKGMGSNLLMIRNHSTLIFEYVHGQLREIIDTESVLPSAIASLNDGRIVLLGTYPEGVYGQYRRSSFGVMRIYGNNGRNLRELSNQAGNFDLKQPFLLCVDVTNNNIYVGDTMKRTIFLFTEGCELMSSYSKDECGPLSGEQSLDMGRSIFPSSLCYSHSKELVFTSCLSVGERGIRILSSTLDFLGFFHSSQMFTFATGTACDKEDKLYVAEGNQGTIHVYKLSQFTNNFGQT